MPRFSLEYKFTIANVIQIAILVVGGIWLYASLVSSTAQTARDVALLQPIVAGLQNDNAAFNTRLTVVESRAETQAKAMDKLNDNVEQLSATVQSLAVTSATVKTDVGYIRAYVEDAKRQVRP